jgi:predicted nucleotidyltransferase
MNNILKEFDEIGFGNQAKIIGTKRVELRSWIDKKINQAKQEERDKFKDIIMRVLDEGLLTMERELNKELTEEDEDER